MQRLSQATHKTKITSEKKAPRPRVRKFIFRNAHNVNRSSNVEGACGNKINVFRVRQNAVK